MQLEIKNFAIIQHSIINFTEGFNVISGETGAGKSILFDALSSILGERTSKSIVRKGEEKAELKAVFFKTPEIEEKLKEKNIHLEDDVVIVKRQISKTGRNIVKINGSIQTTQTVKEVCSELVEICGQRSHQELLQEDRYITMIDENGTDEHQNMLQTYEDLYQQWKKTNESLDSLLNTEREKVQLLDLYRFQKEEIESAHIEVGEDDSLEEEKKFLGSFEKISTGVQRSLGYLQVVDNINDARNELESVSKYDEKLMPFHQRLEEIFYELDDIRSEVGAYIENVDYDEHRLNEIMYRLETINNLKRKYSGTLEGVLEYYEEVMGKIDEFDNKEERIHELEIKKKALEKELTALGETIHEHRILVAEQEETIICEEIRELCMPEAIFKFEVTKTTEFLPTGMTKVRILFNANKGEDLQPLAKVASGGELTRVLLAMKIANHEKQEIPTILFDEVDEGVGGEVGRVIGKKLESLGETIQVICISHLPQVASRADNHFLIQKIEQDERTVSKVKKLSNEERKLEIARMIYGDEKNEITLQQAEEMLKK